jgi:hypothetical protein
MHQGATQAGNDLSLLIKTVTNRVSTPLPYWKVVPDMKFNAATKRFDTLVTELIGKERAKLAAAAAGTGGDVISGSGRDSCLLTQLVQADTAEGGVASENSRNLLTAAEVLLLLTLLYLFKLCVANSSSAAASVGCKSSALCSQLAVFSTVKQQAH